MTIIGMIYKKTQSAGAFTLIELMVAVFIFTIVAGASFAILDNGRITLDTGDTRIDLQEGIRKAMEDITSEVSQSSRSHVAIGNAGASIDFHIPVDDLGSGSMEDISWAAEGITGSFYIQDILEGPANDTRWGAYLWREDPSQPGMRSQRRAQYILINSDLKRRVIGPAGVIIEDITIADNIQLLNFSVIPNDRAINVIISGQKAGLSRHEAVYGLETTFYLRGND
jgi:prepilin-type N-terminal cleavage/methylation domain-containing protein